MVLHFLANGAAIVAVLGIANFTSVDGPLLRLGGRQHGLSPDVIPPQRHASAPQPKGKKID